MKLIIFQPKEVIKRQNKFIKDEYPNAQLLQIILCFASAYWLVSWYFGVAPEPAKYIGMFAYALVFILKWYYFKKYDEQAEDGFKRKWGTEELNKQNIKNWLCKKATPSKSNVTVGDLCIFLTVTAIAIAFTSWVAISLAIIALKSVYYLISGIGMVIRITFEGTHPAYATIEYPIDLFIGIVGINILYVICLVLNKILSLNVIKCNRKGGK